MRITKILTKDPFYQSDIIPLKHEYNSYTKKKHKTKTDA